MDLDRDGRRDILSGSYSRMDNDMAGLFQVLRGQPDGTFRRAEVVTGTDGQPLIMIPTGGQSWAENICTRPFAVDWDGDGDLDLIVGTFTGSFYLFPGEGNGKFAPRPVAIKGGDQPLKIEGNHGDPFAIDWDGDGDLDLLSGSQAGGVQWAENRAEAGKAPALTSFRPLIPPGPKHEYGQILRDADLHGPVGDTRVWADDVNGDGKLDLLVGDSAPLISPAAGLSEAEFKKRFDEWTRLQTEVSGKIQAAANDEKEQAKARQQMQDIYEQRSQFMKEDSTGFVWLYLRK